MLLRALLCEVKGLTPEAKYLLARFIQCFGVTAPVGLGVKELAKQFGLTDRQVSEALHVLLACNVLACSSVPEGRGRPKRQFSLQSEFLRKLNRSDSVVSATHERVVEHLLRHENSSCPEVAEADGQKAISDRLAGLRAKRKPGRLSVVNRLLLGVLLCHADRFGVVRNLGSAELRKAIGFTQESLKHRMQRLIDQGFVRAYVPGVTSRMMFGKAKSTYFLNLQHPGLCVEVTDALALISGYYSSDHLLDEASDFLWGVNGYREQADSIDDRAQVAKLFSENEILRIAPIVQCRLEHYASILLSSHWAQLDHKDSFESSVLLERIKSDFCQIESDDSCRAVLVDILCRQAVQMARKIKGQLEFAPTQPSCLPFDEMDYLILPYTIPPGWRRRNALFRTVLAFPRSPVACKHGFYVAEVVGSDVQSRRYFPEEEDIPLIERYLYGLLTRPASQEGREIS